MKAAITFATLLGCAVSLNAQLVATLNRLPEGSIEIRVRNNSTVSLTAFAVKVDYAAKNTAGDTRPHIDLDPDTVYVDTATDTTLQALEPTREYAYEPRFRSRGGGPTPVRQMLKQIDLSEHTLTTAAVFSDGTTTGDKALITRLIVRRSNMLLAVDLALEALADAGRRNVPREQLIGVFKRLADTARRGYLLPEQRVGLDLYQAIIGKLINLPTLEAGAPFPPNDFVGRETGVLRQQRTALIESQPNLFDLAASSK